MKREVQSDIDFWKENTTLWLSSTGERIKEEEEDILFCFLFLPFFLSFYFLTIKSSFLFNNIARPIWSSFADVLLFPCPARRSLCIHLSGLAAVTIKRYHIESLTSGTHTTRGIHPPATRSWFIPPSSSSVLWSMLEKSLDYTHAYILVSQSSDNSFGPSIPSKQTTAHRSQGLSWR